MNKAHWNILKIKSGTELVAHELFSKMQRHDKTPMFEVWTPFETKRQVRRRLSKKDRRGFVHYAQPLLPGWLFIRFDQSDELTARLFNTIDHRPFLYGVITTQGALYQFPDKYVELFKEALVGLARGGFNRISLRGYDPERDSRKNKQRLYGQKAFEPTQFKAGDKVEFLNGGWGELKFEVTQHGDDVVKLQTKMLGKITELEANNEDLKKIA